ncbi:DUF721 domain-containing protein [Cochlodiniinecator piscidefendens]|uniref:DUF721 domain-containing protein n=1 Tax=Cochlodiniinecator piscidefendens TaxID=2715756 RepID=UPI00140B623E|nr:DUF721 domain-containing protein [Cochlodiniinecator piscidefendens]
MASQTKSFPYKRKRSRGFTQTSSLLQTRIRKASESRGFGESRVLTHWVEIVGDDIAKMARPVKVGYGRGGLGATLTLLTTGAFAPMLEMQKERIREKVNACYGYAAISKVRITQTAPTGFSEGRVSFDHAPKAELNTPAPEVLRAASDAASDVQDNSLRLALESLGAKILTKNKP